MTLEEYKIQDALGTLSATDKEALVRSFTTPIEIINHIMSIEGQYNWFIQWACALNLNMRPSKDASRVEEKDTTI